MKALFDDIPEDIQKGLLKILCVFDLLVQGDGFKIPISKELKEEIQSTTRWFVERYTDELEDPKIVKKQFEPEQEE
jgi:hypothetical protein